MKEIEILIEVKSAKEAALRALEIFSFQGVREVLDIYFFDPLRPDLQLDKDGRLSRSFRLRQRDGKNSLAYKVDHFEEGVWSYSDEFETEVASPDAILDIIKGLGLKELIRVDTKKHTFITPEYEIVLEEVVGLGLFLEVELLHESEGNNVGELKEKIRIFLQSLDIEFGNEQNAGKPELMLRKLA
jgi:predicted adenylyl cyclase CyaB